MGLFTDFITTFKLYGLVKYGRYYSKYQGFCMDNQDPDCLGRLKIQCPAVYGDAVPDYWAWPDGLPAGNNAGLYTLPLPGDVLWIEFLEGDVRYPTWRHGWWVHGKMIKIVADRKPDTQRQVWQDPAGQRLEFDYKEKLIRLFKKDKRVIEINEDGISLGSEGKSAEPGVLGDKNADALEAIRKGLQNLEQKAAKYAGTQAGASAALPFTAGLIAGYTSLATDVGALITEVLKIIQLIEKTKSKVITLD